MLIPALSQTFLFAVTRTGREASPLLKLVDVPDNNDPPIGELLAGKKPELPPMRATFQRAERLRATSTHGQKGMFEG